MRIVLALCSVVVFIAMDSFHNDGKWTDELMRDTQRMVQAFLP